MGLLHKKKDEENTGPVREPVKKLDREAFVQTTTVKKTSSKSTKKSTTPSTKKEESKKMTEKKATGTTETKPTAKKTASKPAEKKETSAASSTKAKPKVWHITKREEEGKWQVKAEGNEKATKLFKTKAEAEAYVKTLTANNEGSRVVSHKKDGTFQKK